MGVISGPPLLTVSLEQGRQAVWETGVANVKRVVRRDLTDKTTLLKNLKEVRSEWALQMYDERCSRWKTRLGKAPLIGT